MPAPLVEFILRFRERERVNAAQGSRPDPIILRADGAATRAPTAQARISAPASRMQPR